MSREAFGSEFVGPEEPVTVPADDLSTGGADEAAAVTVDGLVSDKEYPVRCLIHCSPLSCVSETMEIVKNIT